MFPVSVTVSPIRNPDGVIVGASGIHRDVTEQRQAFETAQRMEAIVESSDDAIIGQKLDGIITSWNPAAERMYGYTSEEIIGEPISLLIPNDRSSEMDANLAKIKAGQHVEHHETIRVRKDGTRIPISLTVSPIHYPDGEITGASGIGRDLTELEHAAHYARSLIEADLDPLVTICPEGRIDDVNEATIKITGVPRETLIGSDYAQYVMEPDKGREHIQQAFEQGSATDFTLTVRHRDGTLTDLLCNASVYRDTGGNVLGVLATGRDVTKQKEAFETAQRMTAIVEYSDDAIIGLTLEGVVTSWNPAAESLFGYTSEEIVGQPIEVLSPDEQANNVASILARIRTGRPVEHFETIRVKKDGTKITVSLTVAPIHDPDGVIVGASTIATIARYVTS
jgi:PAS domain S-box-containing protein